MKTVMENETLRIVFEKKRHLADAVLWCALPVFLTMPIWLSAFFAGARLTSSLVAVGICLFVTLLCLANVLKAMSAYRGGDIEYCLDQKSDSISRQTRPLGKLSELADVEWIVTNLIASGYRREVALKFVDGTRVKIRAPGLQLVSKRFANAVSEFAGVPVSEVDGGYD